MEPSIIVALVAAVQAISVLVLGKYLDARLAHNHAEDMKYRKERERKEDVRKERDEALWELVFASSSGTEVLLHQAHGDHLNGDVEDALRSIHDAKTHYNRLVNSEMARL